MPGSKVGSEVGCNTMANQTAVFQCADRFETWCKENKYEIKDEGVQKEKNDSKCGKGRTWFMTINNPLRSDFECFLKDDWAYCVAQVEQGDDGTAHLQATVHYKTQRVMPIRKYPRAHVEEAADPNKCYNYCKKEESRIVQGWELGTHTNQGKRTDLEALARLVLEKVNAWEEVIERSPSDYVRNYKGLQCLSEKKVKQRSNAPVTLWFTTTSETITRTIANSGSVYWKDKSKDWSGYEGQGTILFDEYEGHIEEKDLRQLMSWKPFRGKTTTGWVNINSETIAFISESNPSTWYSISTCHQMQIKDLTLGELDEASWN